MLAITLGLLNILDKHLALRSAAEVGILCDRLRVELGWHDFAAHADLLRQELGSTHEGC